MSETCPYCDGAMDFPSRDHIVPRVLGGRSGENIIRVCRACNTTKGGMAPAAIRVLANEVEAHAALLRQIADRVDALIETRGLLSERVG